MAFYLFFGYVQDSLKSIGFFAFFAKYSVMLPVLLIGITGLALYLKRSTASFLKTTWYLNLLFVLFIGYDLVRIGITLSATKNKIPQDVQVEQVHLPANRPDIYLIITDEYSGSKTLRDSFNYDNARHERFLRERGFYVAATPIANYAYTALSMAATMDMDYLLWLDKNPSIKAQDYTLAARHITESKAIHILRSYQYELVNYSIFDIDKQPARFNSALMAFEIKLITANTLHGRFQKDLGAYVAEHIVPKIPWLAKSYQDEFEAGNKRLIALTKEIAATKPPAPRFVYTHLVMPHAPFLFDSSGTKNVANYHDPAYYANLTRKEFDNLYLQYLVFTNQVVEELVDDLLTKTQGKAVIMVLSDHGLRRKYDNSTWINNFNATYIPGKDYRLFYDTISNVNQFRILFNTIFDKHLPLLKDSVCRF